MSAEGAYSNLMAAQDFRSFLAAIVDAEKAASKSASLQTIAKRLGIGLSSFKMILNGSRKLSMKNVHTVAKGLKLSGRERDYFESLVYRDQAEDDELYSYYDNKLKRYRAEQRAEKIRVADHSMMQNWFVPGLILYLLDVEKIAERGCDEACLDRAAEQLQLKRSAIRASFEELERSGILTRTSDSRYHFVFERIHGTLGKQRFLKEVFAHCMQRLIADFDHPHALFNAHTLSLPKALVPALFAEYKELIEKYMSFDAAGSDLEIMQVCIQAVPLLRK